MKTDTKQITFEMLGSGDDELNAMYFIMQMFEQYSLDLAQQKRLLEYFLNRVNAKLNQP